MISAGVDGHLPYMTYPESWRGQPKPPPAEFLRPAPKPLPNNRYNGVTSTSSPNATTRLAPQPPARPILKYHPQTTLTTPVNLTHHKDDIMEDFYRNYQHPTFSPFPPVHLSYPHYASQLLRAPSYPHNTLNTTLNTHNSSMSTPLSPVETYSPTTPTGLSSGATFLSGSYSPPSGLKAPPQTVVREKRGSPHVVQPGTPPGMQFKVPSGKEVSAQFPVSGSMKHRLLNVREDLSRPSSNQGPLDLHKLDPPPSRKRLAASTMSPPRSPSTPNNKKALNNNSVFNNFNAGSLIQLTSGELRRIEDMRTEDFVSSADKSSELKLADSTVVRIEESRSTGNVTITLTYCNQNRTEVDVESSSEHPYYVYGQGWASCNPEKTQRAYGLKVHRLQVGDVLITLTPREPANSFAPSRSTTIMTTATTTAMTARQTSVNTTMSSQPQNHPQQQNQPLSYSSQKQPLNLHNHIQMSAEESLAARKRRWSAPDQIGDEEETALNHRRHKAE